MGPHHHDFPEVSEIRTYLRAAACCALLLAAPTMHVSADMPPQAAQALAGYLPTLISDCDHSDGLFITLHPPGTTYNIFTAAATPHAKVTGKSLWWRVATSAGDAAAIKLPCHFETPPDFIAFWLKNPFGHQLDLALQLTTAAGEAIPLGTHKLGAEINWHQLAFAVPEAHVAWPNVDGISLLLTGLKPYATCELYIDQVEAFRPPPLTVSVQITGVAAHATAGDRITPRITLTPAESRSKWPPVAVVLHQAERAGEAGPQADFVVARAQLLPAPPPPQPGSAVTFTDARLQLPLYLPPGQYQLRLEGDIKAAPEPLWPRLAVTNPLPAPELTIRVKDGMKAILFNQQPVAPVLLEAPVGDAPENPTGRRIVMLDATSDADPYGRSTDVWVAPDRFDYSDLDRRLSDLLLAQPDALVMVRVYVGSPGWWDAENRDQLVKFGDGSTDAPATVPGSRHTYASWASDKWRKDAAAALAGLVQHLEDLPAGRAVIGYLLCSGEWGNWQYPGATRDLFSDYSTPQHEAYRKWLRERYGDLGSLRVAWSAPRNPWPEAVADGMEIVGWHQVRIPTPEQRLDRRLGVLREPTVAQKVADYDLFASAIVAATISELAAVVKQAAPAKLCGANYGHLFDQARYRYALQNGGHLALGAILESQHLDFLAAPAIGMTSDTVDLATFGSAEASLSSYGKLLIYQWPAYVHRDYSDRWIANKLAQALCGGALLTVPPEMAGRELAGAVDSATHIAASANRAPVAEIAVILDPESIAYTVCSNDLTGPLLDEQRRALTLLGAPVDVWLLDDLLNGRIPAYKMYLFLNAFYANAEDRDALHIQLARSQATAIYIYAAGAIDRTIGGRTAKQLTGIAIARLRGKGPLQVALPEATYGTRTALAPRFACTIGPADILAFLAGTHYGGLAQWRSDQGIVVWSAAPNIPAGILRDLALDAGVHLYADAGDAIYACADLVGIRASAAGPRKVYLREPADVYDAFTGKLLQRATDEVTLKMEAGETRLLYIGHSPPDLP